MSHHQPLVKYEPFGAEVPLSEPSWCACFTFLSRCYSFSSRYCIGSILCYFFLRDVCLCSRLEIFTELIPLRKHIITRLHYASVGGSEQPFFLSLSLSPFVRNKTALFDSYDSR